MTRARWKFRRARVSRDAGLSLNAGLQLRRAIPVLAGVLGACGAGVQPPASLASAQLPAGAALQVDPCELAQDEEAVSYCAHADYDRAQADLANQVYALSQRYDERVALNDAFAAAEAKWEDFRE